MEGRIFSYIHFNGQVGTLVKITTETDFAARTDEFAAFGKDISMHIAMTNPTGVAQLLNEFFIKQDGITIKTMLSAISKQLGENVQIVEFSRFSLR